MSYILEALKKSQRERHLGKVPSIDTSQLESPAKHNEPLRWIYAAVVLALAAIVIAAYSALYNRTGMWVGPGKDLASAMPVAPTTVDASQSIADSSPPRPRHEVASVARSPAVPSAASQLLSPATANIAPRPSLSDRKDAPERPAPSAGNAPTTQHEALNITVSALEASDAPARDVSRSVALLSHLPLEFQQTVPPMSLDVHVFRKTPEQRFVLINETLYREGEHTAEGAVVEEIVPDGVILEYGGELFRIGT